MKISKLLVLLVFTLMTMLLCACAKETIGEVKQRGAKRTSLFYSILSSVINSSRRIFSMALNSNCRAISKSTNSSTAALAFNCDMQSVILFKSKEQTDRLTVL